jgi:hemerythrin-like metal-binding protein
MAFIEWSADLSVGDGEIDAQHKELVRLINELHDAMRVGKGRDAIAATINGLYDYTLTHFGFEERQFAERGYPDTPTHRQEHASFVAKVADFKSGYEQGKLGLSVDVLNFLWDWLKHHIMVVDMKFGDYLRLHR